MDAATITHTLKTIRWNINAADEQINLLLPVIAGRLKLCGAGKRGSGTRYSLSEIKRELRNWDINKRTWIR